MTWKEFKEEVENKGIKEDSEIYMIDLSGWFGDKIEVYEDELGVFICG